MRARMAGSILLLFGISALVAALFITVVMIIEPHPTLARIAGVCWILAPTLIIGGRRFRTSD